MIHTNSSRFSALGAVSYSPLDDLDAVTGKRSPHSLCERLASERPTPTRQNDHREEQGGGGEPYVIPEHRAGLDPDQDQHRQRSHEEELSRARPRNTCTGGRKDTGRASGAYLVGMHATLGVRIWFSILRSYAPHLKIGPVKRERATLRTVPCSKA